MCQRVEDDLDKNGQENDRNTPVRNQPVEHHEKPLQDVRQPSPPTIIANEPFCAPSTPPETGASK